MSFTLLKLLFPELLMTTYMGSSPPPLVLPDFSSFFAASFATLPTRRVARDRKGAVPVKRRAVSAWWDEQMNPSHTTEADWRLEFRVPRAVLNQVVNAISSHMVFDAPVGAGRGVVRRV